MTENNKDPLGIGHWPRWQQIALFVGIFVAIFLAAGLLSDWAKGWVKKDVRENPPAYSVEAIPTRAVAVDFVSRFHKQIEAAINRTPYQQKDQVKQAQEAQSVYAIDSPYLLNWYSSGVNLFVAAKSQTCTDWMLTGLDAWKKAYPLNGTPEQALLAEKLADIKRYEALGDACQKELGTSLK